MIRAMDTEDAMTLAHRQTRDRLRDACDLIAVREQS
jgi:hypothetical protein